MPWPSDSRPSPRDPDASSFASRGGRQDNARVKSPEPTILHEEADGLPFRACAALAHRAIERAMQIVSVADPGRIPDDGVRLVEEFQGMLARAAIAPPEVTDPAEIVPVAVYGKLNRVLEGIEASTPGRVAFLAAHSATAVTGRSASSAISWCRQLTWDIEPKKAAKRAERVVEHATFEDFRRVRLAYEAGELAASTPVPIESLGPLWPEGEPDWSRCRWRPLADRSEADESTPTGPAWEPVPPSGGLDPELAAAIKRAAGPYASLDADGKELARHTLTSQYLPPPRSRRRWPAALRSPKLRITQDLADLHALHRVVALFVPAVEDPQHALVLLDPATMAAERREMLEWDSARDHFDADSVAEINRYTEATGGEPSFEIAPCRPKDLLVFAGFAASPDRFMVVTRGPAAGSVYFFDHETGIDFATPVARSLAGMIRAIADDPGAWLAGRVPLDGGGARLARVADA